MESMINALGGLAGVTIFIGGAIYWGIQLGAKHAADRALQESQAKLDANVERHRSAIRRDEYLFNYQFTAAQEFMKLKRNILPTNGNPFDDYDDFLEHIASSHVGRLEGDLHAYLQVHQAVLPEELVDHISAAGNCAREAQLTCRDIGVLQDAVLSPAAVSDVRDIWERLTSIEADMRALVWGHRK